jgi:uncharacterized protein YjbI with pentapeptide repeats
MREWYESNDPRQFRAVQCNNCDNLTIWLEGETCHLCGENIGSKICTSCESTNLVFLPSDPFQYIACLDCGVRDESGIENSGYELKNLQYFKTNLQDSVWDGCWIDIGDFRSANLSRATIDSWFSDCDFSGATLLELKQVNSVEPSFLNCNFTGATLAGSDLSTCDFTGSTFNRTDLSNVCFDSANLSNVDLRDAILEGATFEDAILEGTIFPASYSRTPDASSKDRPDKDSKESEPAMREDYMRDEPI